MIMDFEGFSLLMNGYYKDGVLTMNFQKYLVLISLLIPMLSFAQEDELTWPREIDSKKGLITVYQPQLESFKSDTLEGRMAISLKTKNDKMIFCAAWFKAKMTTDLDERTVTMESIEITRIHIPEYDDKKKIAKFSKLLAAEVESWRIKMSLDRLISSLKDVEDIKKISVELNNAPPNIYFRTTSTSLISIDGSPIMKNIENSNLEYVVNTPFFIVKEKSKSQIYIKGGKFWYTSNELLTGWKETTSVPSDIEKLAKDNITDEKPDSISASITEAPQLIVATKPSEIIITDGSPDYQSIEGTSLLYVKNCESDIIMDINSQKHYVLLAGRWFQSETLKDGTWKFTEPNELPKDFDKIPEDSEMASVRASIPNTPEAQDALLEQSIPQTATIDRKTAKVEVSFDGNPEFKMVEGTEVAYAINSNKTVLRINKKYYCVDDAIWFVSENTSGPWIVSDVRPDEVDQLPPESEVYNVKFVYIYNSTPDVVYVGYYPGYTYSYVYGGVVVYGTGYYYPPWYRTYYYPRAVTWGYGVHYNPYTGWGFSVGFSYGWVGWGFHPYHRHYWGPRGYHHGYRHGYNRGYRHGARAGYRAGYRAGSRNTHRNVYRNHSSGVKRTGNLKRNNANVAPNKTRVSSKQNNMFADNRGNIHQRNKDGSWAQKSNKVTNKNYSKPKTKNSNINRNKSYQQLNKSYQNRSRGNQSYNKSRSTRGRSSGMRTGGGRRR